MTYNFQGYAIKCNTWEQTQQLAKIAERQRYKAEGFSEFDFNNGMVYFYVFVLGYEAYYTVGYLADRTEISFTSFITSHPDYRADGC